MLNLRAKLPNPPQRCFCSSGMNLYTHAHAPSCYAQKNVSTRGEILTSGIYTTGIFHKGNYAKKSFPVDLSLPLSHDTKIRWSISVDTINSVFVAIKILFCCHTFSVSLSGQARPRCRSDACASSLLLPGMREKYALPRL